MPTVQKSGAIRPFPDMSSWRSQGSLYLYCSLLLLLFLMLRRRCPGRIVRVNTILIIPFSTYPNQLIWSLLSAEWLTGLVAHVTASMYLSPSLNDYEELVKHPVSAYLSLYLSHSLNYYGDCWNTLYQRLCHCICSHCGSSRNTPQVDLHVCIGSHMPNSKLCNET